MVHIDISELPTELTSTATVAFCDEFPLIAKTIESLMDHVVEDEPTGGLAKELAAATKLAKANPPPTQASPERVAKWLIGMPGMVQLVEEYSNILTQTIAAISENHKKMILYQEDNT
jgi:hypothetical protein